MIEALLFLLQIVLFFLGLFLVVPVALFLTIFGILVFLLCCGCIVAVLLLPIIAVGLLFRCIMCSGEAQ